MAQRHDETRATNVFQVDGEPVSGWYWEQGRWISFTIGADGEFLDPINCGADEDCARAYAKMAAKMRAGRNGRITLNGEEDE